MINFSQIDIRVVASPHKRCLTTMQLAGHQHAVCVTEDWPIPPGPMHPNALEFEQQQEKCYRCYRGHQEAQKLVLKEYGLIFEDDIILMPGWEEAVCKSADLLDKEWEIVSFYGDGLRGIENSFEHHGYHFVVPGRHPNFGLHWNQGSCMYLLKRETAKRTSSTAYEGIPSDIYLSGFYRFCLMTNKICNHNRQYGSHFSGGLDADK